MQIITIMVYDFFSVFWWRWVAYCHWWLHLSEHCCPVEGPAHSKKEETHMHQGFACLLLVACTDSIQQWNMHNANRTLLDEV